MIEVFAGYVLLLFLLAPSSDLTSVLVSPLLYSTIMVIVEDYLVGDIFVCPIPNSLENFSHLRTSESILRIFFQ